jgi:cytidylate kinase
MNLDMPKGHLGEALARAQEHWQARFKAVAMDRHGGEHPAPPGMTIAITREAGSGGSEVGAALGKRLGWPVYDRELLRLIADEMGLRTSLLESVDERGIAWLTGFFESFAASPAVTQGAFIYHLGKVVLSLAAHGECVIVGRGAVIFLPAERTLRVRLTAPLEDRVAANMRRFNLPRDQAARRTEEIDRERTNFVRTHFLKDPADMANYDLVVNTSRFGYAGSADVIADALRRFQERAASKASPAAAHGTGSS